MNQNIAGYFSESLEKLFTKKEFQSKIKFLVENLSSFAYETNAVMNKTINESPIFVINNIISRASTTRPSLYIDELFSRNYLESNKIIDTSGNIQFDILKEDIEEDINRALHIINNKPTFIENPSRKKRDKFIYKFLFEIIKTNIGEYIIPLFTENKTFKDIYLNFAQDNKYQQDLIKNEAEALFDQKIDFVVEMPYIKNGIKGIILDLDEHEGVENVDFILIENKKSLARKLNFEYIYFKEKNYEQALQSIQNFTYNEYFDKLKKNYNSPLYNTQAGIDALQIALSPFAVARIQKIILEFIIGRKLNLNSTKWYIAVIERDIPGAAVALADLKQQFENIYTLVGTRNILPEIKLTIFRSNEFLNVKSDKETKGKALPISEFNENDVYDLLVDSSIFQKETYDEKTPFTKSAFKVKIRSSNSKNQIQPLYFGEIIAYKPLLHTDKPQKSNEKIIESLTYFLRNIFRKNEFIHNQAEAVNRAMQAKSILNISPPATGKSLVYMFAASMQAGATLVCLPDITLLKEHFIFLKNNYFDKVFFVNSIKTRILGRVEAQENFAQSKSLITLITPESLVSQSFNQYLENAHANNVKPAYFVIDEAQILSQNDSDFSLNSIHISASDYFKKSNAFKTEIPVIALTSDYTCETVEYISDILNIDKENILRNYIQETKHNYSIIDSSDGENYQKNYQIAAQESLDRKKFMLLDFFSKKKNFSNKTIVVCAHNIDVSTVENYIKEEYANLKILTYNATKLNQHIISADNYFNFISNDYNIIVADESIALGLDFKDVDNVIFFNFPPSIRKIYQIAGRAARNTQNAEIVIIYDNSKTDYIIYNDTATVEGEITTLEEILNISPDKINAITNISKIFRGRRNEISIIDEILNTINNYNFSKLELIENELYKQFGNQIALLKYPEKNPTKIIVKNEDKTYGFIDLSKPDIDIYDSDFDEESSVEILMFVKNQLQNIFGEKMSLEHNENNVFPQNIDGIELVLEKLKQGETAQISFSLENTVFSNIYKILTENGNPELSKIKLKNIWENTTHHNDFLSELTNIANIDLVTEKIDLKNLISVEFYKYRNKKNTLMALYRLKKLNVISKYLINENQKSITIFFSKNTDFVYKNTLMNIVKKLTTHSYIEYSTALLKNYKGDTLLKKYLYFYINFTYQNVISYNYSAADYTEKFVKALDVQRKSNRKSPVEIAEFYENFFSNKYFNKILEPDLYNDIKNNQKGSLKLTQKYIREINISAVLRKQLINSTEKALKIAPENYTLNLLNLYCKMADDKENIESATTLFLDSFEAAKKNEKLDFEQVSAQKNDFIDELVFLNNKLNKNIRPMLILSDKASWLKNFNQKFQVGFSEYIK